MQKLKATRRAIGGEQNEKHIFKNEVLTLPTGTLIYTGSDGLLDQNDNQRKRLGDEIVVATLEQHAQRELALQKQTIEDLLEQHMRGTTQRDDILWIGFQI